jgi:hypothetical protein
MKKYINGKKYDTETAREIGGASHYGKSDYKWYEETLYRKKTGEYFLYGEGHAASPYRERVGDMWGPGSAIKPLTFDEAREWVEANMSGDEYEAIFGEIEDDGTDCLISAVVKVSSRDRLRREAERSGRSIGEILDALIEGNL